MLPKSLDHGLRGEVDVGLLSDSLLREAVSVTVVFISAPALCQLFQCFIGFRMDQ